MDNGWIALFAVDTFAAFRDLGRANAVSVEWRSYIQILPAAQLFLRKAAALMNGKADAWPCLDGSSHPRQMFAESTLALLRERRWGYSDICLMDFFAAWNVVICNLPIEILGKNPHDVLESCFIPSLILPNNRDNILQYLLTPIGSWFYAEEKVPSEALLCQLIAARLGLADHIHRNADGVCALSHAEHFVHNTGPFWHGGAWVTVRDIISAKMLEGCYKLSGRGDEGSFIFLTYVMQELRGALESALALSYEGLGEQSHLRHIIASFESAEAKRADDIRMQWLARGWRFASSGSAQQIAEVVRYYQSVRVHQDACNVCPCREASLGVQDDVHNAGSCDDQNALEEDEPLIEQRQDADGEKCVDAVTETIMHDEPAAVPHANDAGYRAARQQLIVDEEWAQERQRQINEPSNDDDPAEEIPERDGFRLSILEFSRTPKEFHAALEKDEDLVACIAALQEEGFVPLDGTKIFVSPSEYRAAQPYALGLQSRHVLASERYVEIVLAAVRGLKGKNKVHEKSENRREIDVGSQVEVTGLVNQRELNGHSGIVLRYVQSRARWAVRIMADEREVLVLPQNLRLGDNQLLVRNTFIHIPGRSVASVSVGARTY